jgi:hypothetical protein
MNEHTTEQKKPEKIMTFWQIRSMPESRVKKARIMAAQMELTLPNVLARAIDALEREQSKVKTT